MDVKKSVFEFLHGSTQSSHAYFVGTTLKNPLDYKSGEEIIFKIKAISDSGEDISVPKISCFLQSDDGNKNESYINVSDDGYFYIKTAINRDGFVRLIATACDENKNVIENIDKFEGGAGADIEKIKCETDIPSNYKDFWKSVKEEGFSIPEEIIFKEKIEAEPGFVAYDVHYKTKYGDFLSIIYTYPENAEPKSLKLAFFYMGYGVYTLTPFCREGYLCVRVNTHDILNRQSEEYYKELDKGRLDDYGFDTEENKSPETTYWKKIFVRNMHALNIFSKHPLVNGKDIEFEGGSQGGMQACSMAAHSGVATELRIRVPWACDLFASKKTGRIQIPWQLPTLEGIKYFDTAVAAKFLKCPVYIEAGLGDYICPPSGQIAMYNGITAPKKIRFFQNTTHSYNSPEKLISELSENYNLPDWCF